MNVKQFRYVFVLEKEGSFSRAAEVLNISQPSLSQYIKKIEKKIGIELFDRANGDVRITDAGRVFIDSGRKILDIERQMANSFADLAIFKKGSLIVGTSPYRAAAMMPLVARRFQDIYPGMYVVVREGTTAELIDGLEHGEYDLAVSMLPVDTRQFSYDMVVEEELLLAVPESSPVLPSTVLDGRRYPAIEAGVLDGQALIMLTDTQFMQRQLDFLCIDYGLAVRPAAVVKSLEAQIQMVKAGVGAALVPSGIECFCGDGGVTFYSFAEKIPRREVVVAWRKDHKLSKAAEELKKVICSVPW